MDNGNINPIVSLEHVSVDLGGLSVFNDINLRIQPGEFIVILGPNGAGKTTLLKLLLGLVRPYRGSVQVLGASPRRKSSHWIYPAASPHRTRPAVESL